MNISINSDIKQILIRKDNKKAGPFEINKSTNPFTYFDTANHELYNDNGTLVRGDTEAQETLVKVLKELPKSFYDGIDSKYFDKDYVYNETESDLCDCPECTFSRQSLKTGINPELVDKIITTHKFICVNYPDLINIKIPEILPDFKYFSNNVQVEMLIFQVKLIEKMGGISDLGKVLPDFVNFLEIKSKLPEEDSKIKLIQRLLNIQFNLLVDKNILINLNVKELLDIPKKDLKFFYDNLSEKYDVSVKNIKLIKFDIDYQSKKDITKFKKINKFKHIIVGESIENGKYLLNPEFEYEYNIVDGAITNIIPIKLSKKK